MPLWCDRGLPFRDLAHHGFFATILPFSPDVDWCAVHPGGLAGHLGGFPERAADRFRKALGLSSSG